MTLALKKLHPSQRSRTHDLDIMVFAQGYGEYVFESNSDGNMIQFFEYKVVEDDNSKKLREVTYKESKSRKREWGFDIEIPGLHKKWLKQKTHLGEQKVKKHAY